MRGRGKQGDGEVEGEVVVEIHRKEIVTVEIERGKIELVMMERMAKEEMEGGGRKRGRQRGRTDGQVERWGRKEERKIKKGR